MSQYASTQARLRAAQGWPLWIAAVLLFSGSALSIWFSRELVLQNQQRAAQVLQQQAAELAGQSQDRVWRYQYGLRGVRGHVLTAGATLSQQSFYLYQQTRDIDAEFPGAHGFGFIRRVPLAAEAAFLQEARRTGQPDFRINQLNPHQRDRYVIQYVEPLARNQAAIGLDIASEPHRYQAAIRAMQSGEASLTSPITLVQASGKPQQSFLFLLPVYHSWQTPAEVSERAAHLWGWAYAPLITEEILSGLLSEQALVQLSIRDITETPVLFYQHGGSAGPQEVAADMLLPADVVLTQQVFGRLWQWQLRATPAFLASLQLPQPRFYLLLGFLLTLLLTLSAAMGLRIYQARQQFSAQRNRLAAIVQSSNDAIIGKDLQGVVTSWNQGAEQLFGYTAAEATGRRFSELVFPPELAYQEGQLLQQLKQGDSVKQFVTQRRHKGGALLDVLVNVSPVQDEHGKVVSAATTVRDIGELVASRRQLDQTLRQYKTLLDTINAQFLYVETDPRGQILDVNTVFCQSHGFSRQELLGQSHRMLSSGLHPPVFWQAMWRTISQQQAWRGEICNKTRDGSLRWYETVIMPLKNALGTTERFIALSSDITDRKAAETQRAQLHQLIDTVLSAASEVAIISLDAGGQVQLFNRGAELMLGYQAADMVRQQPLTRLLSPQQLAGRARDLQLQGQDASQLLEHLALTGAPDTWRTELCCQDGSTIPVLLTMTAIRDTQCALLGYLLIALDFSEQLKSELDLVMLRDQLSIAAEVAHLGVWSWLVDSDELWWNSRMFDIYEQPPELAQQGLNYQHWRMRVHPDDLTQTEQRLQRAVAGEDSFDPVFRIVTPERGLRYIMGGATVERRPDGRPWRVTGINLDITAQRELEMQLRQAKEQADAASEAKSQFLANMSHEIRTPLNAVLGMLQLVQQTALNDLQQDYISKTQIAATALLGLLNNILDFSKIDAGALELELAPLALTELLQDLAVLLGATQQHAQVELLFDLAADLPQQILADRLRLQQVLVNLGGNALKFTQSGFVRVRVSVQHKTATEVALKFAVEDSGIGISAQAQQKLFAAFSQADVSISRRFGGTGLGLVICQRLLALMGAELKLDSEPGQGSCFYFTLQVSVLDERPLISPLPQQGLKVLVVDDQPLVRQSLAACLQQLGCQAEVAASGTEALALAAQASDAGEPYQLVLLDWRMPGPDGLETAQQLALQAGGRTLGGRTPPLLMMVTAFESEVLQQLAAQQQHPLCDVLIKPVTPQQLQQRILRALSQTDSHAEPVLARPVSQPLLGLSLLVVEDNALNRQVAEQLLLSAGAKVTLAQDGFMAVALVQQQPFDLVLMDLQMPGMDGLTATRHIRQRLSPEQLPIMAMTANATAEDRSACLAAGMNAHVAKPINLQSLCPQILALTGQHTALPAPAEVSPASDALLQPAVDILQRFGQNLNLLRQAWQQFPAEWQSQLQACRQATSPLQQDMVLHTMQGVAATLGAVRLAQALRQSREALKKGQAPDLAALSELATQSMQQLAQQLSLQSGPASAEVQPATGSVGLTAPVDLLDALERALDSQNMAALDLASQLAAQDAAALLVLQQTEQLEFAAALATLRQLRRNLH